MFAGKVDIDVITHSFRFFLVLSPGTQIILFFSFFLIILILIKTWVPTVLVLDVSSKKEPNAPSQTKPRFLQAMPCLIVPEPRDQMLHNSEIWDKWLTRLAVCGEGAWSGVFSAALMRF